ncbi:DUF1643 domain-containing protein [Nevskia ramosa]|uniref:DUF1643 domain-containing protein n=1 Tax=Nevskia ramosa TaxID=64002 RepID=UPI00235752F2|nr:DUF1643 domain-containing protein [Nevskia ramosa]
MQATFSPCGRFRYLLWDVWDDRKPMLAWCLFNPSTAGSILNGRMIPDHTWTKGVGFSRKLGYGGQVFCNPYAYVATSPKDLKAAGYPIGPENDRYILDACRMGDGKVVCAWGGLGKGLAHPSEVLQTIRRAGFQTVALGFTTEGLPRHPLMLGYDTPLVPYP